MTDPARSHRARNWTIGLGTPIVIILLVVIFWSWDWFIPIVDQRASATLGHKVTMKHLHVALGRVVTVRADGVQVDNPKNFPGHTPLARIDHLTIKLNIIDYLFHHRTVVPLIDVDHPVIDAVSTPPHGSNYTFKTQPTQAKPAPPPQIGALKIENGQVHFVDPKLKADLHLAVETRAAQGIIAKHNQPEEIHVTAKGTYNKQPITGTLTGGALLSLRNNTQPYPVDLALANGATHVTLVGTVQDPLKFQGADLQLTLQGDSMANLYALTGIPIPATPHYRVTGRLRYNHQTSAIEFTDFHGIVGNSDINGTIAEKPGAVLSHGKSKPDVTMNLTSRRVDLNDLGGFIGTKPGGKHEANIRPAQREKIAKSEAGNHNLLPDKPFNLPKLNAANIHLRYKADHIEGKSMPFDTLAVTMDIVNGAIHLHPISLGVGTGRIAGTISLTPESNKMIRADANVNFDHVDVSRLMQSTHVFKGAGTIQGKAKLDATGNSIASWAGNGNGGLSLYMTGGNLSALLVSLSGLQFGNAVIHALGLPSQTDVHCFVGDFALKHGVLDTRTLLLDTGTAIVRGGGTINLKTETIDYRISSKPKHFSIGSLHAPIEIGGTMKKPSIGVGKKQLAERGAAAVALGIVAAPLALLATIQLGTKDPHACHALLATAKEQDRNNTPGKGPVPSTKTPVPPGKHHQARTERHVQHHTVPRGHMTTEQLNAQELKKSK